MKKHFNKKLVMNKEDNEYFENSNKCWTCDNDYIDGDVSKRSFSFTVKCKGSAHRDCNINLRLNHKISIKFHNLQNYDFHIIVQLYVIPTGLQKEMRFTVNNKLSFNDSFQFPSFSLDNLVKNLNKCDFKYFGQEFDNNLLDIVKKKGFYLSEYMTDFEKFQEILPSKKKFYSSLRGKKN